MKKKRKRRGDRLELFTRLSGTSIRDSRGERVGRLTDLIVDVSDARLAYVRIALHPLNGGNDRFRVTVPWSIVSVDRGAGGELRVAVRRETLMRLANAVE